MRDPFQEELPSREEDGIEMEELRRNKRERDEVERERRKRRREEENSGYKRSGEEPEKRQLWPKIPAKYEEFNPEWENLEVWEEDGKVQNDKYSRKGLVIRKSKGKGSRVPTDQTPPC